MFEIIKASWLWLGTGFSVNTAFLVQLRCRLRDFSWKVIVHITYMLHEKIFFTPLMPKNTHQHTHWLIHTDLLLPSTQGRLYSKKQCSACTPTALSGVHFWGHTSLWEHSFKCTPRRLPHNVRVSFMAEQAVPDEWKALQGFCACEATLTNGIWHVP